MTAPRPEDLVPCHARRDPVGGKDGLDRLAAPSLEDAELRDAPQLFLRRGPRLMDFNLFGEAKEGTNAFADDYSLTMSGMGGDPFPTAQLSVTKHRVFDFRASWRQAYYNWNQNDSVVLPITGVAKTLSTGLTDNHEWETVRKFGSADLTVHASNNLRFNFDYYRNYSNIVDKSYSLWEVGPTLSLRTKF